MTPTSPGDERSRAIEAPPWPGSRGAQSDPAASTTTRGDQRKAPTVVVIGAGLAGLTAARALAQNGFGVTLLEQSGHAGGKAGSRAATAADGRPIPNVRYEHGYHIFAPWYRNMLRITDELGIKLEPIQRWHYKDTTADWRGLYLPSTPNELLDVLRNSPLSIPDTLLYFYFCLDMIGMPLSQKAALDRVTRLGLMRSRWYATETLPKIEEESILKAAAVPVHEMSAYTAKILSSYFLWTLQPSTWLRMFSAKIEPPPSLFMLPGDLQEVLIDPYVGLVQQDGVKVLYRHKVVKVHCAPTTADGTRQTITGVEVEVNGKPTELQTMTFDAFVVATPLDVTERLLGNKALHAAAPSIGNINRLRTAPMAALHITLKGTLPRLPKEHSFLMGGEYGLSFIDLSSHWEDRPRPYTLSFISSNFAPLRHLPLHEQYDRLINEICHFLPIDPDNVQHWCLFANAEIGEQLFINTVGSWPDRPDATCANVPNLFFAGDWVKNRIDLACMEGAASAGLNAAHAVGCAYRTRRGVSIPSGPLIAGRYYAPCIRAIVWALAPFVAPIFLWAKYQSFREQQRQQRTTAARRTATSVDVEARAP